jgi:pimeloyl-ACP methyl ester carboxylesterase
MVGQDREAGSNGAITSSSIFNEVDKGGHFAARDEPELFSTEVRAAFTSDLCAEGSSL